MVVFELFVILKQSQSFNIKPNDSFLFYVVDPQNLAEIVILTRNLRVKFGKLNEDFESIHEIDHAHQYYT